MDCWEKKVIGLKYQSNIKFTISILDIERSVLDKTLLNENKLNIKQSFCKNKYLTETVLSNPFNP